MSMFNSMKAAITRQMHQGEQALNTVANRTIDAIDRNSTLNRSKGKRVDKREFMRAWDSFNKNVTKFFETKVDDSMKDMEDELAEYGGIDEDDVIGTSPPKKGDDSGKSGKSAKSEKTMKQEKEYLES